MYFGQPKQPKMQLVRLEPLTPATTFLKSPKMINRLPIAVLSHLNTSSLSFMQPMERSGAMGENVCSEGKEGVEAKGGILQ